MKGHTMCELPRLDAVVDLFATEEGVYTFGKHEVFDLSHCILFWYMRLNRE